MSKKRPNKQVTEKRKAKMAKKSYYASDAAKRKWEEKKARKRAANNANNLAIAETEDVDTENNSDSTEENVVLEEATNTGEDLK